MRNFWKYLAVIVLGALVFGAARYLDTAHRKTDAQEQTVAVEAMATETVATEPVTEPTTQPTETEPQEERFLLTFVGDCTLGSFPSAYHAQSGFINVVGEDTAYPFQNVIDYFENDEWTFANLEGTFCDSGYPAQKMFTFRGPTSYVDILTQGSVEAVTLANNHSLDYGKDGYASTIAALEGAGVSYAEKDVPVVFTTKNGLTIGVYATVFATDTEKILSEIRGLKEQGVDVVIYAPHWGTEGSYVPIADHKKQAHAIIDAGADIICGSHSHVLQPVEEYNGGIIFYSLANFCFGGHADPQDKDTVIMQQEVIRNPDGNVQLGELTMIPACVSSDPSRNNYQPTPYEEGTEGYERVMSKLSGTWKIRALEVNYG